MKISTWVHSESERDILKICTVTKKLNCNLFQNYNLMSTRSEMTKCTTLPVCHFIFLRKLIMTLLRMESKVLENCKIVKMTLCSLINDSVSSLNARIIRVRCNYDMIIIWNTRFETNLIGIHWRSMCRTAPRATDGKLNKIDYSGDSKVRLTCHGFCPRTPHIRRARATPPNYPAPSTCFPTLK